MLAVAAFHVAVWYIRMDRQRINEERRRRVMKRKNGQKDLKVLSSYPIAILIRSADKAANEINIVSRCPVLWPGRQSRRVTITTPQDAQS